MYLGTRPLWVPDEGRYAEIAREMVQNSQYFIPHLDGILYFEKPILFYWLLALAIKIAGLNLWALRSVNAILGVLTCLLTYFFGRCFYDRLTGLAAAAILATSTLYFAMVHMANLDLTVTFFITACLYAFFAAIQSNQPASQKNWMTLAAIFAACALLTKGLIGIVFPILIGLVYLLLQKQLKLLQSLISFRIIFIFILIAAPWHILIAQKHPEFLYFYFIEQHIVRYATENIGHLQPVWFFLPVLFIGLFPWIVFFPKVLIQSFKNIINKKSKSHCDLYFLIWFLVIFCFFSFSQSKLIPYILPAFPPLSILIANHLINGVQDKKSKNIRLVLVFLIACVTSCFLLSILEKVPRLETKSTQSIAFFLKPLLKPNDVVVTYNQYNQDLPFYLNRTVKIVNWENELSFGLEYQKNVKNIFSESAFQKIWLKEPIYAIVKTNDLHQFQSLYPHTKLLMKTKENALISNMISPAH